MTEIFEIVSLRGKFYLINPFLALKHRFINLNIKVQQATKLISQFNRTLSVAHWGRLPEGSILDRKMRFQSKAVDKNTEKFRQIVVVHKTFIYQNASTKTHKFHIIQ